MKRRYLCVASIVWSLSISLLEELVIRVIRGLGEFVSRDPMASIDQLEELLILVILLFQYALMEPKLLLIKLDQCREAEERLSALIFFCWLNTLDHDCICFLRMNLLISSRHMSH